ncbi:tRNA-dihydrouridine(47) synthase [NAD(P)(+)]-like [Mytilus galloprovincialis]|uniref:tRNA-dihydrouridine(47) synthase [NAD(P)(+)]-like n=1 Tax=Mytilus galloprovincialis TaxID=29158 RepID=UPI003F7C9EF9
MAATTEETRSKKYHGAGVAPIKEQYIVQDYKPEVSVEYLSAETKAKLKESESLKRKNVDTTEDSKKDDDNASQPKKIKLKGRNKHRPVNNRVEAGEKLCPSVLHERVCNFGDKCKFNHNVKEFLDKKPPDIVPECHNFITFGKCHYGLACRFGKMHISEELKNKINIDLYEKMSTEKTTVNVLEKDLQVKLWKKKYDFSKANDSERQIKRWCQERVAAQERKRGVTPNIDKVSTPGTDKEGDSLNPSQPSVNNGSNSSEHLPTTCDTEGGPIKLRSQEKKLIDFSNKLYLAPLTTVGNLPFRRVCKTYGADITCSEMAMATNILQGQMSEWALLKRHKSEDLFGIQICGGWSDTLTRCSQLINDQLEADFVDLNCGCPIDLLYKKGEGCALMGKTNKFEQIIRSMKSVLDIPLTVKMRTGIMDNKSIAHHLVPKLRDWGVSMVTIHGRSREQRYTKSADWDYIDQCAELAKPMPVFGNGDILSYEDLDCHINETEVKGCMIARGALIKPWIFTEIKEQRHWDISSNERFDMIKSFVNNGLEHWGSDQQGVETTRRFLLEWLSFLYRYIPVGVLESVPQKINQRPPKYIGRNDLETLLSSPNCGDWLKISEMLLGPVPDGFNFLPKHKANAYM